MCAPWIRVIGILGTSLVAAGGLIAASCNASVNASGDSPSNASATGVWSGKDSVSGLGITALINSAGQATFIRSDGVQFVGSLQVSDSSLAVTVDGYTDFSATFGDGSNFGSGTLNGTVATGSSLNATLKFTTNGGTAISGSWSLTFQALSDDASSTTTISGNYTDSVTGTVLSISSAGVMTSQNASNHCVLNGAISTSDAAHDVYEVAFNYGNCTGAAAVLNGVQFAGLATLNSSLSPSRITLAAVGASSTNKYGIVSFLNGS
jgi:hypothetical protein